jgi:hypothetical protein
MRCRSRSRVLGIGNSRPFPASGNCICEAAESLSRQLHFSSHHTREVIIPLWPIGTDVVTYCTKNGHLLIVDAVDLDATVYWSLVTTSTFSSNVLYILHYYLCCHKVSAYSYNSCADHHLLCMKNGTVTCAIKRGACSTCTIHNRNTNTLPVTWMHQKNMSHAY